MTFYATGTKMEDLATAVEVKVDQIRQMPSLDKGLQLHRH